MLSSTKHYVTSIPLEGYVIRCAGTDILHCAPPQQAQHMGAREEPGLPWTYRRIHEDLQEKQQRDTDARQRGKQIKHKFIRTFQRLQYLKEEKLRRRWGGWK